jgi:hypothetical protein
MAISEKLTEYYHQLVSGKLEMFWCWPDGTVTLPWMPLMLNELHLIPGSFNPLHARHRELYEAVPTSPFNQSVRFKQTTFEISVRNWNKPDLTLPDLAGRVQQFWNYVPVLVTLSPRMAQKAGLFSTCNNLYFHIGYDTARRLWAAETKLGVQGIRATFYVYTRNGQSLADFSDLPSNFKPGKRLSPELENLSSTQIRESLPKEPCGCFAWHTCGAE